MGSSRLGWLREQPGAFVYVKCPIEMSETHAMVSARQGLLGSGEQ